MIGIREIELLKNIIPRNMNLEDISKKMQLSERSIRYKIKSLNEYFSDSNLNVYVALENNNITLQGDISNLKENEALSKLNSYVYSPQERLIILENMVLFNRKKLEFEEYQKVVNISESTLKKDWKIIRNNFKKLGINIINKKYFTRLDGKETEIRNSMLNNIVKYKINGSRINLTDGVIGNIIDEYFEESIFDEIEQVLKLISKKLGIIPTDEAFCIIKYALAICLERGDTNTLLESDLKNVEFLKNTTEYKTIEEPLKIFMKNKNVYNSESEIVNLTEYFLGSHSYNIKYSFYHNWIHIEGIVLKIIENVGKKINMNLENDKELFEGILNHIKPTIYRIKKGIALENSLKREIIETSPALFGILKESIFPLQEFIKAEIDDNELAYLTVFFKLAIERNSIEEIPRIIITCHFGYGISKILEAQLKNKFNVIVVKTIPLHELTDNLIKEEKIDAIITTTELENFKLDIPVGIISPLLGTKDIKKLKDMGLKEITIDDYYERVLTIIKNNCVIKDENNLKKELEILFNNKFLKQHEMLKNKFSEFIFKDNVAVVNKVENFKEALEIIGDKLIKKGSIKSEYLKNCIDIFEEQGPYMIIGKNTILPHAGNFENVLSTDYGILKLKQPIKLEYQEYKFDITNVILLASEDGQNHRNSLLDLKQMIDKENFEMFLSQCNTEEEILEFLKNKK